MLPRVAEARYCGDHRIWLRFADGIEGEVDLADQLWGEMFEPLRNPALFAAFTVDPELGTLVWPNGADLAPEFLYGLLVPGYSLCPGGKRRDSA